MLAIHSCRLPDDNLHRIRQGHRHGNSIRTRRHSRVHQRRHFRRKLHRNTLHLASVNTTTSSCNVTFVPTTAGTVIAQGTYTATDGVHSSGVQTSSNTVTVTLRTTSTAVSCTPATVVVAQTVTCTGLVKDTSAAGTASAPSV